MPVMKFVLSAEQGAFFEHKHGWRRGVHFVLKDDADHYDPGELYNGLSKTLDDRDAVLARVDRGPG